ncbi:ferredoxin family protein [Herbaspirillum sp. RTI4]|uniref:ferredoxin FdxA n=1 Tax=Herbaspirillum sp. RTI4 TaxID=3048640 RepID=UPI002AB53F26|nr:ferredoxin FdxA [Herbaspirillum sp. RTI4]MDY7579450.1 ferredoxin family protein [Herbaspirillum sp. RTI4]MEA9980364.1 ferredoxin family protein [Herbaspirillum sp. RTI4]
MTFVVTDSCIACKYTDCVSVCPMDCFIEGPNFMVIDPTTCIDCSMCVPECPVGAIYHDIDLPEQQRHFTAINATLARHPDWKPLTQAHAPLPDHEKWRTVQNKIGMLKNVEETTALT